MPKLIRAIQDKDGLSAEENEISPLQEVTELGIEFGPLGSFNDSETVFAKGRVPAGGIVPKHAGPNAYALYVLSGKGQLTLAVCLL